MTDLENHVATSEQEQPAPRSSLTDTTPGPWTYEAGLEGFYIGNGEAIATIVYGYIDHPQNIANARLIAAAPDMLAALQMIADDVRSGSFPTPIQNAVIAAIAKATGAA